MEEKKPTREESGERPFIDPANPALEKLYSNSFIVGQTYSDVYLIGVINGRPTYILNMSFTTAKSLYGLLGSFIEEFEAISEIKIHTMDEIASNTMKNTKKKERKHD